MRFIIFFILFILLESCATSKVNRGDYLNYARNDLHSLKAGNPANAELDSLFDTANELAKMYDRCNSISLSDVIDSTCTRFFEISLPEFEKKYSKISGEIRIGNMQLSQTIQNRLDQISECANALKIFFVPIEQIVRTDAEIKDIIPLNSKGTKFSVNYQLEVSYDKEFLQWAKKNADAWNDKCSDIVYDKQEKKYIPFFLDKVSQINKEMKEKGSNISILHWRDYGYERAVTDETLRFEVKHRTNWWFTFPSVSYILNGKNIEDFDIVRFAKSETLNSRFLVIRPSNYGKIEVVHFSDKRNNKAVFSGDYPKNGLKGRWKWDY